MAQVKIYGRRDVWAPRRSALSDAIHAALVETWGLPQEKRFHRFLLLDAEDLVAPRSEQYLVVEIVCFTGRSPQARRALLAALYANTATLGLDAEDLEIVILESPPQNWGIRGMPGDELTLSYRVDV
ncbi:tautomerase family protein [Cellulomonas rhizosphaerae]|uniref:Tautomerase family protein n=1 Tax=Cellulomonas rhizosphaerae TaxID=2293719 RepID=A0A413RHE6_9CELL|nr:tautomerase family protein [Cellulomonas rhizosphaerae]RHA37540.1 tautomerase family protein [Cellulomonas rhizosphaerae]